MKSKYNFAVVKDDEAPILLEAAIQNNDTINEAIQDVRCIDNLLAARKLWVAANPHVRTTSRGHFRKGQSLHDLYDTIISARASQIDM